MRAFVFLPAFLLGIAAVSSQDPAVPKEEAVAPDRFGVKHFAKSFPQATPKDLLTSVVEAVSRKRSDYIVAHLLDPTFVDARIADRARLLEGAAETDLIRLRDAQRQSTAGIPDDQRVPDDPIGFKALVTKTALARASQEIIADVQARLMDDPETLKELRRFLRDGTFTDTEVTSRVTLPDVKERAVYLKKIGERWFIENRQTEEKAPAPAAPPP